MPTVHFLGTGAAVSDSHRTVTMLAFEHAGSVLLVDCGGDIVQRLLAAGVALEKITAVIITHEHPDHVAGFPLMYQKLWLEGRRAPLPVYGIAPALAQARRCLQAFDISSWKDLPEIHWREFPHQPGALVLEDEAWHILATPSEHSVPSIALRIAARPDSGVCVYTCDTGPTPALTGFAAGADILIHEATGPFPGHSTITDAARTAAEAQAGRLYLVHLPRQTESDRAELNRARAIFPHIALAPEPGSATF